MNPISERIQKLQNSMEQEGFPERAEDLEDLKKQTRGEEEEGQQRPLYDAHPTAIPGTWSESDGDLVKTSKD